MRWWSVLALTLCMGACKRDRGSASEFKLAARPSPHHPSAAVLIERRGSGRAAYLGFDVSPEAPVKAGDVIELTHYFESLAPFRGDYNLQVSGEAGDRVFFEADHAPAGGTSAWKKGEFYRDVHKVKIPADATPAPIQVLTALFAGDEKLTVEAPPGKSDGSDRIRAGEIAFEGAPSNSASPSPVSAAPNAAAPPADLPVVVIPRAKGVIKPDGVLDEADWAGAARLSFSDSMGKGTPLRWSTQARLLYDDTNLYVAFESNDADVSCPFTNRDDPIYDHESVEVFIMPNATAPNVGPYVELQACPSGVIFDASFTGRRQGMDKSWNAAQTVGTKIDGTLNQHDDEDRGWVSEWVVPWKSLRWLDHSPTPADEWRMNAFRIENRGEYTAWSPPRVGDFHNTERFGRMRFAP